MTSDAKLRELEEAVNDASSAYLALQSKRNEEDRELRKAVRREIDGKYGNDLALLRAGMAEAEAAYQDALAEAAKDKLKNYPTGIVVEWNRSYDRWQQTRGPYKQTGRRGRYEIRARESQFASNIGYWRLPKIGEVFIRLIKKNGTPGTGFVEVGHHKSGDWLPEGEKPQAEAAP